jgi:hypothetical protein
MTTQKSDTHENKKNLFCKTARANEIISLIGYNPFTTQGKEYRIRECPYGADCKGAHTKEEFQNFTHITRFNHLDKSTFNFIELNKEILQVLNDDKVKIKGNETFKEKLKIINELNFIELVQLWHDLACFYRKLAKEVPKMKMNHGDKIHGSGYKFSEEIPKFYLSEMNEDFCWSFVRTTNYCTTHQNFRNKINQRQPVTIGEICVGHSNCKEGVHNLHELLCIDNFLSGNCNCITKEKFDREKELLENKIAEIKLKISTESDKKKKDKLNLHLKKYENDLHMHQRSIHYSEKGMIPFNIQYSKYIAQLKEESDKKIKEEEKVAAEPIKKVIKVSLGKKSKN